MKVAGRWRESPSVILFLTADQGQLRPKQLWCYTMHAVSTKYLFLFYTLGRSGVYLYMTTRNR